MGSPRPRHGVCRPHLTKTKRELGKVPDMQSRHHFDLQTTIGEGAEERAAESELGMLRDVFRLLPGGVTVQDEEGRFLLLNDAAAAQLGIATLAPAGSKEMEHRRETCIELLRSGHSR